MESTFKAGDIVRFDVRDWGYEEWEYAGYKRVDEYDKKLAKIISLKYYLELGDKNGEYYDIQFLKDGTVFEVVSGYHLSINE